MTFAAASFRVGYCLLFIFVIFLLLLFVIKLYLYIKTIFWRRKNRPFISVGFFHPYCNAGGGGERVLWAGILAVQTRYSNAKCLVYTGDAAGPEEILQHVEQHFNIKLPRTVQFVYLKKRYFVEAKYYPYFTLIMQSLGSVILAMEAILKHVPDIYLDTMGYAWTLPIFTYLGSCKVGAYVHYPTISTDMLQTVINRQVSVNNQKFISNSYLFSHFKLIYYRIFAFLYSLMGRQAEVIMVNSTWTQGHILELWKKPNCTYTVYPPCDVSAFQSIPLEKNDKKGMRIISIAQFRPEKDHKLQLKAFHEFLNRIDCASNLPVLVLIGSCRHEEDYERVKSLKDLSNKLGVSENIEFKINVTFQEILSEMNKARVALHTMLNEHFGIGVVECMSSGLIMIAHDSGGPKLDIVKDFNSKKTGFLASDIDSFAEAMEKVWRMDSRELHEIGKNARDSVARFSTENFEHSFLSAIEPFFI